MAKIHHKVDKNVKVMTGHVNAFNKIEMEKNFLFVVAVAIILIILYFLYVFNRFVILLKEVGDPTSQVLLLLPHLILLPLFGVPIVRQVLLWIKFTPFYLPRKVVRKMRSKTYNKIRLKRFVIYFAISLICFLIAIFYLFIF
jgi:hypothetical protein